jgi:outer membrane protein insertion porin family
LRSKIFIEPGDFVNDNSIDKIKSDLTNLKYINSVNISKNIMDNKSDLLIDLSENKKTGNFILGGTFSGDTGLGFALGIKDLNLLGSGNEIDASLDLNSERTLFKINYKQYPYTNSNITNSYYFANQELDLTNSYGYKQKEREIGYSIGYLYNENLRLSSGINYINYEGYAGKNNNSFIKDNIGDFNNFLLKLSILSDKTNDILYPSKGTFNSLQFELSPTNISDDAYYKSRIKNDIYFSVKNTENFFFISNRAGIVQSLDDSKVKTGNTFSLGGLNFKGFDYRGIGPFSDNIYLGGNKFFTSTIGYGSSFLFDQKDNVYMKLFYTTGSLWDSDYSSNSNFELRSSLGLSFDILTPVGPISLSYATTIDKDSSDKNKSFNFSIGTSF